VESIQICPKPASDALGGSPLECRIVHHRVGQFAECNPTPGGRRAVGGQQVVKQQDARRDRNLGVAALEMSRAIRVRQEIRFARQRQGHHPALGVEFRSSLPGGLLRVNLFPLRQRLFQRGRVAFLGRAWAQYHISLLEVCS